MKIFFDTEFVDNGSTVDLISIGLVREDGAELYLESAETDWTKASEWVLHNVKRYLGPASERYSREDIARKIREFAGDKPEFWAYYASYDWVLLCQLYGRMLDVPKGWPMFVRDLRQILPGGASHPAAKSVTIVREHHALDDARWVRDVYMALNAYIPDHMPLVVKSEV
jgi:hypothetical protein